MASDKFTPEETKRIEDVLEPGRYALVNPMFGGGIAIKALASKAEVDARLASTMGIGIVWDAASQYGSVSRKAVEPAPLAAPVVEVEPLSGDEKALLNHVTMWGSDGYPVLRVRRVWSWRFCSLSSPRFATKRAAVTHLEGVLDGYRQRLGELAYRAAVEAAVEARNAGAR